MRRKKHYQDKFGKYNYYRALDDISEAEETTGLELDKAVDLNQEIISLLEIVTRGITRSAHFPEKSPTAVALLTLGIKFARLQNVQARARKSLDPIRTSLEILGVTSEQVLEIIKQLDEINNENLNNQINEIINGLD